MEKYINIKGGEVIISSLSDKELVSLYKFFLRYNNILKKRGVVDDEIKDVLKSEIGRRKIKMANFL